MNVKPPKKPLAWFFQKSPHFFIWTPVKPLVRYNIKKFFSRRRRRRPDQKKKIFESKKKKFLSPRESPDFFFIPFLGVLSWFCERIYHIVGVVKLIGVLRFKFRAAKKKFYSKVTFFDFFFFFFFMKMICIVNWFYKKTMR
jgi:hypothetical protein